MLKPVDLDQLREALRRSEVSMGKLKEISSYLTRFQQIVSANGENNPQTVHRKMSDLVDSVLKLKLINPAARMNLLRIFEWKLSGLVKKFSPGQAVPSIPADAEDGALLRYFNQLADVVIMHNAEQSKSNTNHINKRVCDYLH